MRRRRVQAFPDLEVGAVEPLIEGARRYARQQAPSRPGLAALVGIGGPALVEGLKYALGGYKKPRIEAPGPAVGYGLQKIQKKKILGIRSHNNMAGTVYKKKRYTKRKTLRQVIRTEIVRKLETKNHVIAGSTSSTTGDSFYPSIVQGDSRSQRSGDKIYCTRIEIFVRVSLLAAANTGTHWANIFLATPFSPFMVATDIPTTGDLLDYDTDTTWVHYKKQVFLPLIPTGGTRVGNTLANQDAIMNFSIPVNRYIHYNGSSGTDLVKGMPQLGLCVSDAGVDIRYNYRLWFKEL